MPLLVDLVVAGHIPDYRATRFGELTLSRVPVLIGQGPSLFGPLPSDVDLEHVCTEVLTGGMVQTTYRVLTARHEPGTRPD